MSNNLAMEITSSTLDKVKTLLEDRVQINIVEQVFVFVVTDEKDAKELFSLLQENGFENITFDTKGTTIIATAGGATAGGLSASVDDTPTPVPDATADATSSSCLLQASNNNCSYVTDTSNCENYYQTYNSTNYVCGLTGYSEYTGYQNLCVITSQMCSE